MHNIKYLRVVLTDRCNLKCFFCHKEGCEIENNKMELSYENLYKLIFMFIKCGIKKIKLMGGEPTLYECIIDLIKEVKKYDSSTDLSIITNGTAPSIIYEKMVNAGIDRINISLHGYDLELFKKITKGTEKQFDTLFKNIDYLNEINILGKINYVLLKDTNEEEFQRVLEYIHKNNYTLDVLNYLSDNPENIKKYYYSYFDIKKIIQSKYSFEMESTYKNPNSIDSHRIYLYGGGIINLKINELRDYDFLNHCEKCYKKEMCKEGIAAIRLTNSGIIKPCLFRDDLDYDLLKDFENYGAEQSTNNLLKYLCEL